MTTAEFQKEFLSNATAPEPSNANDILQDFVQVRNNTLMQAKSLGVGETGCKEICKNVGLAFLRRWMLLRFPAVDLSFTKREWWINVKRDADGPKIVGAFNAPSSSVLDPTLELCEPVPRYFNAEINAKEFAFGYKKLEVDSFPLGSLSHGQRGKQRYSRIELFISASLPDGIMKPKNISMAQMAISHLTLPTSLLMPFGIDFKKDLEIDRYSEEAMKIKVIWAPNLENLSLISNPPRPKGDPAVLLTFGGHAFLLDFYDTPDESSITNLIREFSEGKLAT